MDSVGLGDCRLNEGGPLPTCILKPWSGRGRVATECLPRVLPSFIWVKMETENTWAGPGRSSVLLTPLLRPSLGQPDFQGGTNY